MTDWQPLYNYWFSTIEHNQTYIEQRLGLWFFRDENKDDYIKSNFLHLLTCYENGELTDWMEQPKGYLSLIILLDQIPRNAFRGSAGSHQYDNIALELSLLGIEQGIDKQLDVIERVFFYLPIEHSEQLEMQHLSVRLFSELANSAPESLSEFMNVVDDYAKKHLAVIEQFGRYPHRNHYLGRTSTPEELAFLKLPESQF